MSSSQCGQIERAFRKRNENIHRRNRLIYARNISLSREIRTFVKYENCVAKAIVRAIKVCGGREEYRKFLPKFEP